MRPDEIRRWLQVKPFRPFRLWIPEVTSYEIRHPDQIIVSQSAVTIALPAGASPLPLDDHYVAVALLHISRLETLSPTMLVSSNGG